MIVPPLPRQPFQVTRPRPIVLVVSCWILVANTGVGVIRLVINVVTFNWSSYLAKNVHPFIHNGHHEQVTPAIAIGTVVTGFAIALLFSAIMLLLAFRLREGGGKARIVLTVLVGLELFGLTGPQHVLVYLGVVPDVAAIILSWLPRSNDFFRRVKADRRLHTSRQLP